MKTKFVHDPISTAFPYSVYKLINKEWVLYDRYLNKEEALDTAKTLSLSDKQEVVFFEDGVKWSGP